LAPGAAPTNFVSNVRAYETLPEDLRARLEGLDIVHLIDSVGPRQNRRTRLDDIGGPDASRFDYPRSVRPALWTHPLLGMPLLFVLEQQASHFAGMTGAESDPLIREVFAHLYRPEHSYEHAWNLNDFIVWDNLALQHGRRANPNTVRRSLRRVAMNTKTTAELNAGTGFDPARRAARASGG
jgi:alpha-ketoglutarate-dependent taurine dioxygenase